MAVSRMPKGNTVPIDPDVKVPEAVKRAAAAAAALQKETYPDQNPGNVDPNAPQQQQTPGEADRIKIAEPEPAKKLPDVVTTVQEMERAPPASPAPTPTP